MTTVTAQPENPIEDSPTESKKWVFSWLACFACVTAVAALLVGLYPATASWFSAREQAKFVDIYDSMIENAKPRSSSELIALAHEYNAQLSVGASLDAWANIPRGTGMVEDVVPYKDQLRFDGSDVMSRIRIPKINVDLPIYHGTDDETLLKGAGHLEGTSLPVGGLGTHSVITAHRGLAEATMFTNLNKVGVGDRFTVETLGEVMTYEIRDTKVVSPENTEFLRANADQDLVTLVTCTPLGINTHRILVTAERVTPTPQADIEAARAKAEVGFPYSLLGLGIGIIIIGILFWRSGYLAVKKPHTDDE
ncbi:class C sortase [Corynebacterium kutscheri]|uniref:class C sortase n=1 Tax=Corynebacterium kutscheri TaxID=35755 RepID=UPI0037BED47F